MNKIIKTIIGDLNEKKEYRQNEKRAKALPAEYAAAYKQIKHYIFATSGILNGEPLKVLVNMFEDAAEENRCVIDIIGTDVAAFADELVRGEKSYRDLLRKKLNSKMAEK